MNLTRIDFLKKLVRLMLVSLLAGIAIVLGSRAAFSNNCSDCPGRDICKGESDCSKFLHDKK